MNRWLTHVMVGMLFLLLAGSALRSGSPGGVERPEVGYLAPDFQLRDLGGKPIRLADYRGRTVLLNFWATWCPPCQAEMPELKRLQSEIPDLVILGVDAGNTESSAGSVTAFMHSKGYDWPVPVDADGKVNSTYRVVSLPTSFFIDREGIIRAKFMGPMSLPLMKDLAARATGGR